MAGKAIIAALAVSLSACVSTQGVTATCDINYVGPPPRHYLEAGRALNPQIIELPSNRVSDECDGRSPVGCIAGNGNFGFYLVIITDEPERWGLTRQQVIDHEVSHWGGWPACHPV